MRSGAPAIALSYSNRKRSTAVQPVPPCSRGQSGASQPRRFRRACHASVTSRSRNVQVRRRVARRIRSSSACSRNACTSRWNARSSPASDFAERQRRAAHGAGSARRQCTGEAVELRVRAAVEARVADDALVVVADREFVGEAHRPVHLHRLVADAQPCRSTNALAAATRAAQPGALLVTDRLEQRGGLLERCVAVDEPMLQGLEATDGLPELLAVVEVLPPCVRPVAPCSRRCRPRPARRRSFRRLRSRPTASRTDVWLRAPRHRRRDFAGELPVDHPVGANRNARRVGRDEAQHRAPASSRAETMEPFERPCERHVQLRSGEAHAGRGWRGRGCERAASSPCPERARGARGRRAPRPQSPGRATGGASRSSCELRQQARRDDGAWQVRLESRAPRRGDAPLPPRPPRSRRARRPFLGDRQRERAHLGERPPVVLSKAASRGERGAASLERARIAQELVEGRSSKARSSRSKAMVAVSVQCAGWCRRSSSAGS